MAPESDGLKFTRRRIQKQMEQAEKERKSKLQKRRMELVALGAAAMKKRNPAEAVQGFLGYLKLLEEAKGAGPGGLVPSQFDRKAELSELVLVTGVYWDLVKIYDRSRSPGKHAEFLGYLEKFMLFARGMPYEPVCTELLRKYLRNDKPMHAKEFRDAYRRMTGNRCFVATSLIDKIDLETLQGLRSFRDQRLKKSRAGRAVVAVYYRIGPGIASGMDRAPDSVRSLAGRSIALLERLLRIIPVILIFLATAAPAIGAEADLPDPKLAYDCKQGDSQACVKHTMTLLKLRRYGEAREVLSSRCESVPDGSCEYMLGLISQEEGKGGEASTWLKASCAKGLPEACKAAASGGAVSSSFSAGEAARSLIERFRPATIDGTCPNSKGQSHYLCLLGEYDSLLQRGSLSLADHSAILALGGEVFTRDASATEALISKRSLAPKFRHGHALDLLEFSLLVVDRASQAPKPTPEEKAEFKQMGQRVFRTVAENIKKLNSQFKADKKIFTFDRERLKQIAVKLEALSGRSDPQLRK